MGIEIARYPIIQTIKEFTDLDGNRGMDITYVNCPTCGSDISFDDNPEMCDCGQLICWDIE